MIRQLHQLETRQVRALVDHGHVKVDFLGHEHRALVALGGLRGVQTGVTRGNVAELRDRPRTGVERLGRLALFIHPADEIVGVGVEGAARRELVADGVCHTERLRAETFVFERG